MARAHHVLADAAFDADAAVLVFDTETASLHGVVVQLAFVLHDWRRDIELFAYDRILRPPPAERFDPRAVAIHGIERHEAEARGVAADVEVAEFLRVCAAARRAGVRLVAHNATYDVVRVNHTRAAHGVNAEPPLGVDQVFCSMRRAASHVATYNRIGRRKTPRNEELYCALYGAPPVGRLHDALVDVRVTAACYVGGARRGWWKGRRDDPGRA